MNQVAAMNHAPVIKKPPPCISYWVELILGVKTPRRRGKKLVVTVEESNGREGNVKVYENGHA